MNKKKNSKINLVNIRIQEKIKEEKKEHNKISNKAMKLINEQVIVDYCTNQKVNAKLILNKYLNIIKYLVKENLNLKKIIERNKLENARKDDIIIKHENELRNKSEIMDNLINKLGIDISKENIKVCYNSKEHESNIVIQENDKSSKVKSEKLVDLIKENNNSINSEIIENEYFRKCYKNNNIEEKEKYKVNISFDYKNENSMFTKNNKETFLNKYIKDENHISLLKKECSPENGFINIHESIEKSDYANTFHGMHTHNTIYKIQNPEKIKPSIYNEKRENQLLADKKLIQKEETIPTEKSSCLSLNENNKLYDHDEYKCIGELNNLIINKSNIKNFENYSKKYEMEYNSINARNVFANTESFKISQSPKKKKILDINVGDKDNYMEISRVNDNYVKIKNKNNIKDNVEEIKVDRNNKPQELSSTHINDNTYYEKCKEDERNLNINSGDEIYTNITNKTNKSVVSRHMKYLNNDTNINSKLIENNHYEDYNKTNSNILEEKNRNSSLEDDNYEDLENIMSTILKLRKKNLNG